MGSSYEISDLCKTAKTRGFPATERLIHDWIARGFLDHPTHDYKGHRGKRAFFSENQLRLFLTLCHFRFRESNGPKEKDISGLSNIPVWLWLWWGDSYASINQVKRALKTWGETATSASWRGALKAARRLTQQLGILLSPSGGRPQAFLKSLATLIYQGKVTYDRLLPLVQEVSKRRKASPAGPAKDLMSPEAVTQMIVAKYEAARHVDDIGNETFEWARFIHRSTFPAYLIDQPRLATDRDFGYLFSTPTAQQMMNNACSDLLLLLGMARLNVAPSNRAILELSTWRDLGLRVTDTGEVATAQGIILPRRVASMRRA